MTSLTLVITLVVPRKWFKNAADQPESLTRRHPDPKRITCTKHPLMLKLFNGFSHNTKQSCDQIEKGLLFCSLYWLCRKYLIKFFNLMVVKNHYNGNLDMKMTSLNCRLRFLIGPFMNVFVSILKLITPFRVSIKTGLCSLCFQLRRKIL